MQGKMRSTRWIPGITLIQQEIITEGRMWGFDVGLTADTKPFGWKCGKKTMIHQPSMQ